MSFIKTVGNTLGSIVNSVEDAGLNLIGGVKYDVVEVYKEGKTDVGGAYNAITTEANVAGAGLANFFDHNVDTGAGVVNNLINTGGDVDKKLLDTVGGLGKDARGTITDTSANLATPIDLLAIAFGAYILLQFRGVLGF